jgi:hypothetical protein
MTRLLVLLCLLGALSSPVWAGDPGDDFWATVAIRKANWELDDRASETAAALRADKVTAAAAAARWKELHGKATQLKAEALALEDGSAYPQMSREVTKMMRLQIQRLEALIKAARVETEQGREAARPLWARQLIIAGDYRNQEALVLDLMNWIEEHP